MAETEWSSEARLQQGMRPGVQGQQEAWGWAGRNGLAPSLSEPLSQPVPPPHSFPAGLGGCWSGAVPGPSSQVGSLSSLPALPTCGTPWRPQPRCSRLPQGPRPKALWSSLPSCPSCWPSSSLPYSPCSSSPGTWTGSRLPWEGGVPDLGRLFPSPRSRPPTLLPIASSAGEVFPEGQTGVTVIDQGIPSVLEPVCVLVGALTPVSLVPLPA